MGDDGSNMTYPLGCPWWLCICIQLGFTSASGLCIQVTVLGLQSAPLVWVQHAPVAVLGESTRSGLGFSRLDPAGNSASWVYPDWYSTISSPRARCRFDAGLRQGAESLDDGSWRIGDELLNREENREEGGGLHEPVGDGQLAIDAGCR